MPGANRLRQIISRLTGRPPALLAPLPTRSNLPTREKRPNSAPANTTYRCILSATGVAQNAPNCPVTSGVVRIYASNGTTAGNAANVQVATSRDAATSGPNTSLANFLEATFPCTNLNQLWFAGTTGDGVEFSVKEQ
jgi:hypothetical protein